VDHVVKARCDPVCEKAVVRACLVRDCDAQTRKVSGVQGEREWVLESLGTELAYHALHSSHLCGDQRISSGREHLLEALNRFVDERRG